MTTKVTVQAHCDPRTTKVEMTISNKDGEVSKTEILDSQSVDCYVYDDRKVEVKEVPL